MTVEFDDECQIVGRPFEVRLRVHRRQVPLQPVECPVVAGREAGSGSGRGSSPGPASAPAVGATRRHGRRPRRPARRRSDDRRRCAHWPGIEFEVKRCVRRVARSECPPAAKKFKSASISASPRSSPYSAAIVLSVPVAGGRDPAVAVSVAGSGSERRSTLPLGSVGSSSRTTTAGI